MPRYKVVEPSYINGTFHEVGAIVDYVGEVGKNLQPVDARAKAVVAEQAKVPRAVTDLLAAVRTHAATRGDLPSNANDEDIRAVSEVMATKPSNETVAAVKKILAEAAKALAASQSFADPETEDDVA